MEIALYLSHIGFKGIWFGAAKDQIEQPKKYMKFIIENSYLKYLINELLKESVFFQNDGELRLKNLTEMNARSARADFIVYDEEAQAEKDAYNAAVNILAGSDLGLVFHISTPTKASVFEENYDRLKMREIKTGEQFIFSRTWYEVPHLAVKKDWYEEQERILPGWYFRQEHCASFELAMGAVFQNVDYSPYSSDVLPDQQLCSGVDWNPVNGHWLVGMKWAEDMKTLYVMEAHDLGNGYTHEMTTKQFNIIRPYYTHKNHCTVEEGGINEAYVKWLKEREDEFRRAGDVNLHFEEWDGAGVNKLQAVSYIIQNGICIRVDRMRFPQLAKQIEDLHWDKDATEPKLAKDPADSPHALDAFLHAISPLNRMDGVMDVGRWY